MLRFTIFMSVVFLSAMTLFAQQQHELDWAFTGGGESYDVSTGIATDDLGNSYVTGHFRDTMNLFETDFEFVGNTMYLLKVTPEKDLAWSVVADADGVTGATGFKTVYKDGYVYVLGEFRGEVTFTSGDFTTITLEAPNRTGFVAKYSDNGIIEWVTPYESSHGAGIILTGSANNLVVDDDGGVYVSTHFRHDIEIDDVLIDMIDDPDDPVNTYYSLLFKLDSQGAYQWHWNSIHEGNDRGEGLDLTPTGNVVWATRYDSEMTVNDVHYQNEDGGIALIEFESDGTYVWDHHTYTSNTNRANFSQIAVDGNDNIFVAGEHRTTLEWDNDNIFEPESTSDATAFILKADSNRELEWAEFFGDPEDNTNARGLALRNDGYLYVAGQHAGTMELSDALTISNDGSVDLYWAVMETENGLFLDAGLHGSSSMELFGDLDVSSNNHVFMNGQFMFDIEIGDETYQSEGSFDFFVVNMEGPDEFEVPAVVITDFPWLESFEDVFPPEGWMNIGWEQSTYGDPHTGDEFAYSNDAGSMLTTPEIQLPDDEVYDLSYWYRAEHSDYPQDMDVHLSTDGSTFDVTVSEIEGATNDEYQQALYSLEDFAGESIWVRFTGQSGDGGWSYGVLVDDVSVGEFQEPET